MPHISNVRVTTQWRNKALEEQSHDILVIQIDLYPLLLITQLLTEARVSLSKLRSSPVLPEASCLAPNRIQLICKGLGPC